MNCSLTDRTPARNVRADVFVAQMERTDRAALVQAIERQDMAELERAAIAHRIKQAREEAGLSQPEMADALGVIARTYQNYESVAKPRTPWGLMNQIATITGKSTEWLIHGDRPTPDLMGIAGSDQVDGGFVEFREHVAALNERLDAIEGTLEKFATNGEIEQQLKIQTRLLKNIERLAGALEGAQVVSEPLATGGLAPMPPVAAPPPIRERDTQAEQRPSETTERPARKAQGRRRSSS